MTKLGSVLTDLLTESDNVTHDLYRYLSIAAILTGLGLNIYSVVWQSAKFDMQEFGIGVGALFAGMAVALNFKKDTT